MRSDGAAILTLLLVASSASATVLPPGFQESNVVCAPHDVAQFAWAPDGGLFVASKFGHVWRFQAGTLTLLRILPTSFSIEQGINGLAVDPDYPTNQRLWIYYTTAAPARNRVSRFTYDGVSLIDEQVILEGPLVQNSSHNGGDLTFAADKTLFVAMGDDVQGAATAQNPFDVRGKILHVDRDGLPAPGNPFADGTLADPRVWALGLRNPYRFRLQPGTENLFIADVGHSGWEELDLGIAGANYGWPSIEGFSPAAIPAYTYPIHGYPHLGGPAAIIGGDFAEPGDFSPEYEGSYFFADYMFRELYRLTLDASFHPAALERFATEVPTPTDIEFGPDGALYYASFPAGQPQGCIRRIAYLAAGNRQPVAQATAAPAHGQAPLTVTLDGSASYDVDPGPLTFVWDPGTGAPANQAVVQAVYPAGVYEARLTVHDGAGGSDAAPPLRIVSGNRAPQPTLSAPAAGSTYDAGQTIAYFGTGSDPEEGTLPCSRFAWQVLFHHAGRSLPFLGPVQGTCSGTFVVPDRGPLSDADAWYEIFHTVTDSGAPLGPQASLRDRRSVAVLPNTSEMTFRTRPLADLLLTLDGEPFAAPRTVQGVVQFVRALGAVDAQPRDGHVYRWLGWSDGGAREHEIRTPASDATLEAEFGCDVIVEADGLRLDKTPGGEIELRWQPVNDPCLATGGERYRIYGSPAAQPLSPPGSFPIDPPFGLVGTSAGESLLLPASTTHTYFLVLGVGSDARDGPAGSY